MRPTRFKTMRLVCLAGAALAAAPSLAAEVTAARLLGADSEPQNWLTNHRSYDGQRFSPLARVTRDNVKNLRIVYTTPLGGGAPNMFTEATPLAEDGALYVTDSSGVVYKIDGRTGESGRILWRMDPKQERQEANRGVALWGNYVVSVANQPARVIATDKETGKVAWETNVSDTPAVRLTGAPLAIGDKILLGAAGSGAGIRDWLAALDAATGKLVWRKYVVPAPGEPGSETWKDKNNAWQTGGGPIWVTGTYDPESNQTIWGTGNPVPEFDPTYRPGDNLFTNSAVSHEPETGKMNWYFQYTPGDLWDYDEVGTHILFDADINGARQKLLTHSARNGFVYTMRRANGQILLARPYVENINWTKGIDQKTGRPLDYDPGRDVQVYSGQANQNPNEKTKKLCPSIAGGNNFWPSSYSPKTRLLYIPALWACSDVTIDTAPRQPGKSFDGGSYKTADRYESDLVAVDPLTGEIRKKIHMRYPNYSGALTTAGGVVVTALLDGTVAAYDDTTLAELWKINIGSGVSAPPMTFESGGKQFIAIVSGPSNTAKAKLVNTPELKDQRNATILYVFGL